ncbi:hypothetical protein LRS06_02900 [Hymenobacter sp. J193]|uniref:hypothetical protein n=1 Tax=Hymenobacter sp. J193 TaxID=2898429 RepID=UPI002151444E|nr:hypothetical protein [Hymenobacter sp. J193]MCR5886738.1 hypothetical protein [Hymenobacter sp. J193]
MWRISILCTLLLSSFSSMAQGLPGYVVTLSGDTLRGTVAEKRAEQVEFYADGAGPAQVFQASQLRGYGLQGQPLIASRLVKQADQQTVARFVLPTLPGPASLFTLTEQPQLLLQPTPAADTLYELTASNWHLLLNRHLKECAGLSQTSPKVLNMSFSTMNVRQRIYQYNSCVQPQWKADTRASKAAWQRGYSAKAGVFYCRDGQRGAYGQNLRGVVGTTAVEWTAIRASGLLFGLQAKYGFAQLWSAPFQPVTNPSVEERFQTKSGMVSGTLLTGQRFGRFDKTSLFVAGGFGPTAILHERIISQLRPRGEDDFQTVASRRNSYIRYTWHYELQAGVYIPVTAQRQLQLSVVGRHFSGAAIDFIGTQVGYCWNRK